MRATATAFSDFCSSAVALEAYEQAAVDNWSREIASMRTEAEKHSHRLALFDRLLRGCRVRIVRCTDLLNGCEGIVLSGQRAHGATTAVSARRDALGTRDGKTDDDARCAVTRATQAW